MTKISVAMATYNGTKYLKYQLDSIIKQTYQISEIVIVDDCSFDGTWELLNDYDFKGIPFFLYRNEVNLGVVETFKHAISKTTGDFTAICDQDDIWVANKIEKQLQIGLSQNDEKTPLMITCDLELINSDGEKSGVTFWSNHSMNPNLTDFKKNLVFNDVVGCTMLINKEMVNCLKSMPNSILMHDHWINLIAKSFGKCIVIDTALILYREHDGSVTDKRRTSLYFRIMNFLKNTLSSTYLSEHILQAKQFLACFDEKLDSNSKATLQSFIALENQPSLYRWLWQR